MDNSYVYNRTYWKNDVTLLNAENMNNIEECLTHLFFKPVIPDNRSISSEEQFSHEMSFKYLSYPKFQVTYTGEDSCYDKFITPGIYQVSDGRGHREVLLVTAPSGLGGYGSGYSSDSEAYRFQLSFQHEQVRYRSCWATSSIESPEPGDWTEWKDLNMPNNMNFDSEEELEAELNTYIGHHSIRYASVGGYPSQYIIFTKRTGSEEFPKATYQVKLEINYNSAFHLYGRLYNSTNETWGEWNELTKPKDFVSWGYIGTIKQIRDNPPAENKVYYFTKTTDEGNIPGGNYYCIKGFKDGLIHITPTDNTGIWYSLTPTGNGTAVVHYTAKQTYDASDPTPISGQGVAQALSNISATGLTPGSINNEDLFSLDMMFKYLSYPKVQLSVSGEKPYDNIVDPGVYQVGGYGIPSEVLIVMAPQADIGSGSTGDSDAYRYQIKMGDQKIEYRSSDDLENGWSEWVQLNTNVDQTYQFDSSNPQSGTAVAQAIASAIIDAGSLPIYKKKYDTDYGDTEFNTYTDTGIYQVDTFTGEHEVVMVLSPDSEAYRMQLWFKYDNILYRGMWCTTDGVFADSDWEPWISLTSGCVFAGNFSSLAKLCAYNFKENVKYMFRTSGELASELTGNICEAYIEPYDGALVVTSPDNHYNYYKINLTDKTATYVSIVESALSSTSGKPVSSRVIKAELDKKMDAITSFDLVSTYPTTAQFLAYVPNAGGNSYMRATIDTLEDKLIETGTFGGTDSAAWWQSDSQYYIKGTYQLFGDYCTISARAHKIAGRKEVSYNLPVSFIGRAGVITCNGDDIENATGGDEVVYIVSVGTNTSSSGYSNSTVHIKRQDGEDLDSGTITFTLTYKYKGDTV